MKVFISYAHEDYLHAKKLYDKLNSFQDIDVWFDKESLLPGQKWELEIRNAITSSRYFLLLLSTLSTKKKGFYQREIRKALEILEEYTDDKIYLIQVRLDDCQPHYEQLKDLQYVDLFPDYDIGFERILRTLQINHGTWVLEYVNGNSFQLSQGVAGTRQNPNGHHTVLFPLDTTLILGDSNIQPPFNKDKHTVSVWNIPFKKPDNNTFVRCYLLFGSLRHYGGLHSPVQNDFVEIYLNNYPVDGFYIGVIPEGQTDYFHQRPFPDIPKLHPFNTCETIYAWSVPVANLGKSLTSQILVRIATRTKWDIDYVGLMLELSSPTNTTQDSKGS